MLAKNPNPNPIIYLSHSGGRRDNPDWFVVEPRDDPEQQIRSLLRVGRRVLQIITHSPRGVEAVELSDYPRTNDGSVEHLIAYLKFDGHR